MISIIIPCYNHNEEVKQAVKSALAQSGEREIIVVDDGSENRVRNEWGKEVRFVRHWKNRGLSAALNSGIEASKGNRFVILAADDELHKEHLALLSVHNADIVSCDMIANGRHVRACPGSLETLKQKNCHSYAALVKKSLFEQVGGFKETMNPSWEDYEFWLNCAKHGAVWNHVQLPLHKYNRTMTGRDAAAQGKDALLRGKLEGYHQDVFEKGRGVVGVVIPCYEQEEFVANAIQSVVSQEYPHVKTIVVDDASSGDVRKAVGKLPASVVRHDKNLGLSAARNTGARLLIDKYNVQYLVMLDADDEISPDFIEKTMGYGNFNGTYVYTDVRFFGDAHHNFEVGNFSCRDLWRRHLHACTFLMPAKMWSDVNALRGYGYDESMREGYEDWEFIIAAVQTGWRGLHLAEVLFNYRNYANGSMRTEAAKISKQLVAYIRTKHSKEAFLMCETCGHGQHVAGAAVVVKGIGAVEPGIPILVTYTGSNQSTQTRFGVRGRIYKFSGRESDEERVTHPRTFTIDSIDANKFEGPFTFQNLVVPSPQAEIQHQSPPPPSPSAPVHHPPPAPKTLEERLAELQQPDVVEESKQDKEKLENPPDDLTRIRGVRSKTALKLIGAGYATFEAILEEDPQVLAKNLHAKITVAERLQSATRDVVDEDN